MLTRHWYWSVRYDIYTTNYCRSQEYLRPMLIRDCISSAWSICN